MDRKLRSDEVRELLYQEEGDEEYNDDNDSEHESDLDSNVSLDFENELHEELGEFYDNSLNEEGELNSEEREGETTIGECEDNAEGWQHWTGSGEQITKFTWSGDSGYKPPIGLSPKSPLEFFQLFFTDDLLLEIIKETNRYALEKIHKNMPLQKKSMWWSWKEVTLSEFKAFIGVLINMGMNEKKELADYFSTDWVDCQPFFKDVFSKERFFQIFRNLHVCPPPTGPIAGTLTRSGKVRNVLAYLDNKFREFYVPSKKVSVDESTVGYKGRVIFKVYNKDKPTKWGIKVFVLSESKTGYICAMEPYFGSTTTDHMGWKNLGTTSRVVLHLVNKLKQSYGNIEGMHVFTDRFYTNLDLAKVLHDWKVHLTGTIMTHRKGLPEEVRPQRKTKNQKKSVSKIKLQKGEIKSYIKDDKFSLLLWKDKNLVVMLSTLYGNATQAVSRIKKNGVREVIKKPTVICKYNKSMGGVDLADQYIAAYSFSRKTVKWWRKVFFWLVETSIVNSFILFKLNTDQKKLRQIKFRKMLVKELIGNVRNNNKRGRPSDVDENERLNGKLHLPYALEGRKTKDCVVCSDRRPGQERKRSKFFCKSCVKQPGLHMGECFEKYHTEKKLTK